MNEEEKKAIEYFKKQIEKCIENANICDENDFDEEATHLRNEQVMIETVLNLIQKQQAEIEKLRKENKDLLRKLRNRVKEVKKLEKYSLYKKEFSTLNKQIEKKDKRISDLEFALMDMVLQFADENKDCINTMGLSALEIAFGELDFDNPMKIKEVHKKYKKLAQEYYK